jgi:predicted acylesterase/phospholipase RssA
MRPEPSASERVIGLAMSGGGSRAAAFHLGCLRALYDRDLLRRIRVVSGISGGSLLAALWAYGPQDFAEFDDTTVGMLRRGLQSAIVSRALRPASLGRDAVATAATILSSIRDRHRPAAVRSANRTDALADALADVAFGTRTMQDVTHHGLDVVLTATDLRTSNAVRFGSARSSCSRYGSLIEAVPVATAVAASAAYPLFLPAIERIFTFDRDGQQRQETVLLSDGGVYDNLGLSVLEPGRSAAYTLQVYDLPYIIACDAGRGELQPAAPHFLPWRVARAFDVVHRRVQDPGRARLHEWAAAGRIRGFVMAYLGMRDERLPLPIADLVPRQAVANYGTNFSAMRQQDLDNLATRGEQLVRSLLLAYCPDLG